MAVQLPNFQAISFDQANPALQGAVQGQRLLQNTQALKASILANQIAKVKSAYAQPMAEQALIASKQTNEFYPQLSRSMIGLQGAQAGLAGSQSGLAGAQTTGANIENQMNNLKLHYLQQRLGGQTMGAPQEDSGSFNGATGDSNNVGAGNGGNYQSSQSAPTSSGAYGISTPQPDSDDIQNKMLLGMDTFAPKLQNAKTQQQDQYHQYQEELSKSIQDANIAQKTKQLLSMFNNAMNNSYYRGASLGMVPSKGWSTAMTPGSLSNEQQADSMSSQLLPTAMTDLRSAMGRGQFSIPDLHAAQQMKVDRTMTDEQRDNQTKWLNGVADRMEEKAKFFTMLGNPQSGAQRAQADMLWQTYQEQNPLVSDDGKTFNPNSLGNWPVYATPKAIQSIKETGTYVPSASARGNFWMQLPPDAQNPKGRIVPIKKGNVEAVLKLGGRPL